MDTYAWTISGNATISGPANGQTVAVIANGTCGTFTLNLTSTIGTGNTSCSRDITISDAIAPVISALPAPSTIDCNVAPTWATPTVTDNCNLTPTLNFADATTPGTC